MTDDATEFRNPDATDADQVVEQVKASHGDLVIDFESRIGARPFMRYTPYTNNRGVRVNMWSCMSVLGVPMPGKTLLFRTTTVHPDDYDDGYEDIRMFTSEWVWRQVYHSRGVAIVPVEESPFDRDTGQWIEGGEA